MKTATATISLILLAVSLSLVIIHLALYIWDKHIKQALASKKLTAKQRADDEERLRIIKTIQSMDATAYNKIKQLADKKDDTFPNTQF